MVLGERQRIGATGVIRTIAALIRDESGQDLLEYALLAGFIGVASALVFPAIADEMGVAYGAWLSGAEAVWDPPAPGS